MRTASGLTSTDPTSLTDDPSRPLTTADLTADLLLSATATTVLSDPGLTGTGLTGTGLTVAYPAAVDGPSNDDQDGAGDAAEAEPVLPCWTTDPDLWFAEAPADVEAAKALCVPCPLREACLAGALERREPWGVWGGQLLVAGVVVPRKRPRGRPRKVDVAA